MTLWFLTTFLIVSAIKYAVDKQTDTATIRAERDASRAESARQQATIDAYRRAYGASAKQTAKQYQPKGYWQTLGIQPTKDKGEILRAFRTKAQKAHPDKGGSASAFQTLFEARNAAIREIGA